MDKWISDEEFERQFAGAQAKGRKQARHETRAKLVTFNVKEKALVIDLLSGVKVVIPTDALVELRGADEKLLAEVTLSPSGNSLHWQQLNVDFSLGAAIADVLGKEILSERGRIGGQARTQAKKIAARENGKKGGRPRKAIVRTIELHKIPQGEAVPKVFEIADVLQPQPRMHLTIPQLLRSDRTLRTELEAVSTVLTTDLDLFGIAVSKASSASVATMPLSNFSKAQIRAQLSNKIGDCNAELAFTA